MMVSLNNNIEGEREELLLGSQQEQMASSHTAASSGLVNIHA